MTSPARTLRALVESAEQPLLLPGAANALAARVVEDAGYPAVYVTGAGVTNTYLGMPDHGLLSLDELCGHVDAIADVVGIPVVVDADTGFGNALNVQRTVRRLERAGAAAIQLEDQVSPKKCGHFAGKEVVSKGEFVGKVRAAVDARRDDDLLIVARTDARAAESLDAACDRAAAYLEAGADILFVEAPESVEEMRHITTQVPGTHVANMVEGGKTPLLSRGELGELGFTIALYANATMRGAVVGMREVLAHLNKHGDTREAGELMISWNDRQSLVRKPDFDRLEQEYAASGEASS
ncbi:isocitrate lyase/PEP mutase family protein [Prauserella cavernicola]|uniref:Isocitrate lyase/phosphoenolpyruvate mutase family protein n=1 Tax=Prauserella cavernicola TaxID=2800127 RepID=A0A934QPA1_9PSEU|nr:isocitrate lyase/phosphoenolpyruvate mutase family protein [Prauserella cavernicola]MBK1783647.1 isocitrate lyase/phosphoenolpyruvate mutase family protein [Prauserella cavernicola]